MAKTPPAPPKPKTIGEQVAEAFGALWGGFLSAIGKDPDKLTIYEEENGGETDGPSTHATMRVSVRWASTNPAAPKPPAEPAKDSGGGKKVTKKK